LQPLTVMQRTDGSDDPQRQRVDWFSAQMTGRAPPRIVEPHKCAELAWHSLRALPERMPSYERVVLRGLASGNLPMFTANGFDR
jgi:8-oxo-dGTP diphosphatase